MGTQGEKGEVSIEWGDKGSSAWVDPWRFAFSGSPPAECPPELVTLGTCAPVDTSGGNIVRSDETVVFTAPFSEHVSSYTHTPVSSDEQQTVCAGLSGFPKTQTDTNTGLIGYSGFAWGGLCSHYNFFGDNPPSQQANAESLLGDTFTAARSGRYRISADMELHGNGSATAGAGAVDIAQALIPGKIGKAVGIATIPDLANPANLFPSVASARNTLALRAGPTNRSSQAGFKNLAVDSLLVKEQEEVFTGTQTITMTIDLKADQEAIVLSGLITQLKAWGNATVVVKPLESKLTRISVQFIGN